MVSDHIYTTIHDFFTFNLAWVKGAQSEIPVHLLNYQVSIVKVKRIV